MRSASSSVLPIEGGLTWCRPGSGGGDGERRSKVPPGPGPSIGPGIPASALGDAPAHRWHTLVFDALESHVTAAYVPDLPTEGAQPSRT